MSDKRWKDHAEFLGTLTDYIIDVMVTDGRSLGEYTEWLAEQCFKHAHKHCLEDFGKVSDEPPVNGISVSGDRVNRSTLNVAPSWDKAKREPHVYTDSDDDSVITSQDECGCGAAGHCTNRD